MVGAEGDGQIEREAAGRQRPRTRRSGRPPPRPPPPGARSAPNRPAPGRPVRRSPSAPGRRRSRPATPRRRTGPLAARVAACTVQSPASAGLPGQRLGPRRIGSQVDPGRVRRWRVTACAPTAWSRSRSPGPRSGSCRACRTSSRPRPPWRRCRAAPTASSSIRWPAGPCSSRAARRGGPVFDPWAKKIVRGSDAGGRSRGRSRPPANPGPRARWRPATRAPARRRSADAGPRSARWRRRPASTRPARWRPRPPSARRPASPAGHESPARPPPAFCGRPIVPCGLTRTACAVLQQSRLLGPVPVISCSAEPL